MNRDASVTLEWGDGSYTFRLGWGELAKVQEATDTGPFVLLERLRVQSCRLEDITAVILWGLVGGANEPRLTPTQAGKLVNLYVKDRPPAESILLAYSIMAAGCVGAPEEEIEKKSGAPAQTNGSMISPTEKSDLKSSTATPLN